MSSDHIPTDAIDLAYVDVTHSLPYQCGLQGASGRHLGKMRKGLHLNSSEEMASARLDNL